MPVKLQSLSLASGEYIIRHLESQDARVQRWTALMMVDIEHFTPDHGISFLTHSS